MRAKTVFPEQKVLIFWEVDQASKGACRAQEGTGTGGELTKTPYLISLLRKSLTSRKNSLVWYRRNKASFSE